MLTNPDALASMKKEWSGLIDQGVFDLGAVREYDAVATLLLRLKPRVGRIFWVVMMVGMCRWPTVQAYIQAHTERRAMLD